MRRSGDTRTLVLDFEGLDEHEALPMAEAYACRARTQGASLYFGRRGEGGSGARNRWSTELRQFVEAVSGHAV
jgi:hypothetical protein